MNRTVNAWLALQMVCVAAGISIGYSLGHQFPFTFNKDGWDVLTAIGTVGAMISALVIWGFQTIDSRRQARERALVHASSWWELFFTLHQGVFATLKELQTYDDSAHAPSQYLRAHRFYCLQSPLLELSADEISALTPLPGDVAIGLARALAALRRVRETHRLLLDRDNEWQRLPSGTRAKLVSIWAKDFFTAVGFLSTVGSTLAGELGEPRFDAKKVLKNHPAAVAPSAT